MIKKKCKELGIDYDAGLDGVLSALERDDVKLVDEEIQELVEKAGRS